MDLKDRFSKIEDRTKTENSFDQKNSKLAKIIAAPGEVIHWKSDVTSLASQAPAQDQSWSESLDLLQKALIQFLQIDSIHLSTLNLSEAGHHMTHELAVLFAQANELPFAIQDNSIALRLIGNAAFIEITLHPETKNLVKEAVDFSHIWNKRYQDQLKMNFSFLMGKATLKISYKSGTMAKKKNYIVHSGADSEA